MVKRAHVARGHLVIVTVAAETPEAVAAERRVIFTELGALEIDVLDNRTRGQAANEVQIQNLADALARAEPGVGSSMNNVTMHGLEVFERFLLAPQ